jgi:transposase
MRGRPLVIDWQESADVLHAKYKRERNGHRRARLQALYLLRSGSSISAAGEAVGVDYRTVQRWVAWYREGGLNAVLLRTPGYAAPGRPSRLTSEQRTVLLKKARSGQFRTVREAVDWVHREYGVTYTYTGMHALLNRNGGGNARSRAA